MTTFSRTFSYSSSRCHVHIRRSIQPLGSWFSISGHPRPRRVLGLGSSSSDGISASSSSMALRLGWTGSIDSSGSVAPSNGFCTGDHAHNLQNGRHHAPFDWASNRCMSRHDTQLAPCSIDMADLPVLSCVAASSDLNPSLGVLHASSVGFRHVVLEEDKGEGRG
jgi:hypothetical protein